MFQETVPVIQGVKFNFCIKYTMFTTSFILRQNGLVRRMSLVGRGWDKRVKTRSYNDFCQQLGTKNSFFNFVRFFYRKISLPY